MQIIPVIMTENQTSPDITYWITEVFNKLSSLFMFFTWIKRV